MFKVQATRSVHAGPSRSKGRLAAAVCGAALTAVLAGNVAAAPLERDDGSRVLVVTPRLDPWLATSQLKFKLATTAGYDFLVFG